MGQRSMREEGRSKGGGKGAEKEGTSEEAYWY